MMVTTECTGEHASLPEVCTLFNQTQYNQLVKATHNNHYSHTRTINIRIFLECLCIYATVMMSVAVCLVFHFVERVEGMGHGDCFGEWTFVSVFQHLVLTGWIIPV